MFSDVRQFTAISEIYREDPQGLTTLMNRFLTPLSDVIMERKGTIDKYMGDAIMATFGTPHGGPRDATNAMACARAMLRAVDAWNEERAGFGDGPIAIGIGLHFGPAVMGDIGDERRLEYAVVGDTVNVAARLESLTRTVHAPLVVSDDAVSAAKREGGSELDAALAGLVKGDAATVRGRAGEVGVWTLTQKPN